MSPPTIAAPVAVFPDLPLARRVLGVLAALTLVGIAVVVVSHGTDEAGEAVAGVELELTAEADGFERAVSAGLGDGGGLYQWRDELGAWGIVGGSAKVMTRGPGDGGRSITTVDAGSADVVVQATVLTDKDGAGFVVRYRDPDNYLAVLNRPCCALSAWITSHAIVAVENGEETVLAEYWIPEEPEAVLAVRADGSTIEALRDGRVVALVTTDLFADETRVGLIARKQALEKTSFDDVVVEAR